MSLAQQLSKRSLAFAQSVAVPYAEGAMNSLVTITRYGGWTPVAGEYGVGTPQVIYDDETTPGAGAPAGITPTSGPVTLNMGDEPEFYDGINLYIPLSAPTLPMIDDVVKVVSSPDPQFSGRQFRVTSVVGSGRLISSIHMMAQGIAPSRTTQT